MFVVPTPSSASEKKTGLLDMPGELKNRIYRVVLVRKGETVLTANLTGVVNGYYANGSVYCQALSKFWPPLLRTCKLIEKEAKEIHLIENHFAFYDSLLTSSAVNSFEDKLERLVGKLKNITIHRSVQIGDMKKRAEIFFTAKIDSKTGSIILQRPKYEPKVFVPGKARLKSVYLEPCRCHVDSLARRHASGRVNGRSLLAFLHDYCDLINEHATEDTIDICKKCDTMCRY